MTTSETLNAGEVVNERGSETADRVRERTGRTLRLPRRSTLVPALAIFAPDAGSNLARCAYRRSVLDGLAPTGS